eukprot:NODE_410_length_7932_cov_0.253160.p2 type:complete len:409 gc:universal NODE_410_length_7932_cov_0.253160:1287-2513(+)
MDITIENDDCKELEELDKELSEYGSRFNAQRKSSNNYNFQSRELNRIFVGNVYPYSELNREIEDLSELQSAVIRSTNCFIKIHMKGIESEIKKWKKMIKAQKKKGENVLMTQNYVVTKISLLNFCKNNFKAFGFIYQKRYLEIIVPKKYNQFMKSGFLRMKDNLRFRSILGDAILYNEMDWRLALHNDPDMRKMEYKRLEEMIIDRGGRHFIRTGQKYFNLHVKFYCKLIKGIMGYNDLQYEMAEKKWKDKIISKIKSQTKLDADGIIYTDDEEEKVPMHKIPVPMPKMTEESHEEIASSKMEVEQTKYQITPKQQVVDSKDTNQAQSKSLQPIKSLIEQDPSNDQKEPKFKLVVDGEEKLQSITSESTIEKIANTWKAFMKIYNMKPVVNSQYTIKPNSTVFSVTAL